MTTMPPHPKRGLFDRVPPQNIDAERSVLGAILINPDATALAVEILLGDPERLFYHEPHQYLYASILRLFAESKPIDAVTLLNDLVSHKTLDKAGGAAYIAELTRAVPTSANVQVYAKIVKDCSVLRGVITLATRVCSEAYAQEADAQELISGAVARLQTLSADGFVSEVAEFRDVLDSVVREFHYIADRPDVEPWIPYGIPKLDTLVGLRSGEMTVGAARPSVGKTAFALRTLHHAAKRGIPCLFVSAEMDKSSIVKRMLQREQGLPSMSRLRWDASRQHELQRMEDARRTLLNLPLEIYDKPGPTIPEVSAVIRQFARRNAKGVVAVDYLQLLRLGNKYTKRLEEVSEISRSLKALARETKLPLLVLCQLNRGAEDETSGYKLLAHLRESGSIEQDADVVLTIRRLTDKEKKSMSRDDADSLIDLTVAKHRNGPTGAVVLRFDGVKQDFYEPGSAAELPPPPPTYVHKVIENIEDQYEEDDALF